MGSFLFPFPILWEKSTVHPPKFPGIPKESWLHIRFQGPTQALLGATQASHPRKACDVRRASHTPVPKPHLASSPLEGSSTSTHPVAQTTFFLSLPLLSLLFPQLPPLPQNRSFLKLHSSAVSLMPLSKTCPKLLPPTHLTFLCRFSPKLPPFLPGKKP